MENSAWKIREHLGGSFEHTPPHLGSLHKKDSYFSPTLLHNYVWVCSRDCFVFPDHPQHCRDSRFSRLGTETPRLSVQVSSRNRTRNRLQAKRGLGISLGTETMKLQVSVSEPESGYTASCMKPPKKYFFTVKNCLFSRNRNRNAETLGSHPGIRIGLGIDV